MPPIEDEVSRLKFVSTQTEINATNMVSLNSIAISLKRIADMMDGSKNPPKASAPKVPISFPFPRD